MKPKLSTLPLLVFAVLLAHPILLAVSTRASAQTADTCISSRIGASSDDAEQYVSCNSGQGMFLTYGILQSSRSMSPIQCLMWWGMRFDNVSIPRGATITSATVKFRSYNTSGTTNSGMTLYGQSADDPPTFTINYNDLSSRVRTTSNVAWTIPQWQMDQYYQTVDFSPVVQEVVNNTWWDAGDAMVIIGRATVQQQRAADSFDGAPADAPLLQVCYQGPMAVTLTNLTASAVGDQIVIAWETTSEVDNAGFNLYRSSSADDLPQRINSGLIPALTPGSTQGNEYRYTDTPGNGPSDSSSYWLEDVSTSGVVTRHGPASVAMGGPNSVTLRNLSGAAGSMPVAPVVLSLAGFALGRRLLLRRR